MELVKATMQLFNFSEVIAGLVFFFMGFIILLQFKQYNHLSDLKIVKKIWILALFGIIQGLAQWVGALLPITLAPHVPSHLNFWFNFYEVLLNTISYCFLYGFAVEMMALVLGKDYYLRMSAIMLFSLWLVIFLLSYSINWVIWLNTSLTWSRLLLAFPGSILAALALNLQVKEFGTIGISNLVNNLYGAVGSFCLYAVASGLDVPNGSLFTIFSGSWHAGLSDILRTVSGLGMAGFIIRIMEIFNIESNKKLTETQHREARLQERLRIGADLHDGVIQSLYAIGLGLEVAKNSVNAEPLKTQEILTDILVRLESAIDDTRYFILDLTVPEKTYKKWPDNLYHVVEEFSAAGLNIKISYDIQEKNIIFDLHKSQELINVIREALSNVLRHAKTKEVALNIQQKGEELQIQIIDEGQGFVPEEQSKYSLTGYGINNMADRIAKLGGEFQLSSKLSQGTMVQIAVPLKVMETPFQEGDFTL